MYIRTAAPSDILLIDQLLSSQCQSPQVAEMVMTLRESGKLTLSLVACNETGDIEGYAGFASLFDDEPCQDWQHLQVLTSNPHRDAIRHMLLKESLDILYELGYPACTGTFDAKDECFTLGFEPIDVHSEVLAPEQQLFMRELNQSHAVQFDIERLKVLETHHLIVS